MSDPKDFVAGIDSDQRRSPTRVVFVTRRTSAQVKVTEEDQVQTFPEVLFRAALAIELLAIALVLFSLFFNAPLEGLADPTHTPNPAKAPWYFLGLQELLHYFPPVVAGVLVPTVLIVAMIVIPYFNINIEATGLFLVNRTRRLRIFYLCAAAMLISQLPLPGVPGSFDRNGGPACAMPTRGIITASAPVQHTANTRTRGGKGSFFTADLGRSTNGECCMGRRFTDFTNL